LAQAAPVQTIILVAAVLVKYCPLPAFTSLRQHTQLLWGLAGCAPQLSVDLVGTHLFLAASQSVVVVEELGTQPLVEE
jgi:hypothetical protein